LYGAAGKEAQNSFVKIFVTDERKGEFDEQAKSSLSQQTFAHLVGNLFRH